MNYTVVRSDRRTLSLQITPAGEIVVRCPRRFPAEEIRKFVAEKEPWLRRHLENRPAAGPEFTREDLEILREEAKYDLPRRAARFAPLVGVDYGRITLRCQKSRWGSCSAQGNLNFNCLLMLAPEEVRDYVVVHELCHRRQMNHSPRFWAEVAKILPDYESRRAWLKEQGNALIARLP